MKLLNNKNQNLNINNHNSISFKKNENNKEEKNKKTLSTTEIVLGVTALAALGVATFAIISSHKNKKAYKKILDEKISKILDEKSNEIINDKVVKTLNEKSNEIINNKVTQKVNETTNQILDDKIQKAVEEKTTAIIENKFNDDVLYDKFRKFTRVTWNRIVKYIKNNPEIQEGIKKFDEEISKLNNWMKKVDSKLGFIESFNDFSIPNMRLLSIARMYFPNLFR